MGSLRSLRSLRSLITIARKDELPNALGEKPISIERRTEKGPS